MTTCNGGKQFLDIGINALPRKLGKLPVQTVLVKVEIIFTILPEWILDRRWICSGWPTEPFHYLVLWGRFLINEDDVVNVVGIETCPSRLHRQHLILSSLRFFPLIIQDSIMTDC